jgi:hypothetical protein
VLAPQTLDQLGKPGFRVIPDFSPLFGLANI